MKKELKGDKKLNSINFLLLSIVPFQKLKAKKAEFFAVISEYFGH